MTAKLRILSLHWKDNISSIVEYLVSEDGIIMSKQSIWLFLKRYSERGIIARKERSGFPPKLSPATLEVIAWHSYERRWWIDCYSASFQTSWKEIYVSITTILQNRKTLGWIYRGSPYCQLIRNMNNQTIRMGMGWSSWKFWNHYLEWWLYYSARQILTVGRKEGETPCKASYIHPVNVHVWAGISKERANRHLYFQG